MSRDKAAELMSSSNVDMAVYRSKRNQRAYWQRLTHEEWVEFCNTMGEWFNVSAQDEWDDYVKANNERKAKSDADALLRKNGA